MSRSKILLTALVWPVLTAAMLELSLPLLNHRYSTYFRRRITPSQLNLEDARRVIDAKTRTRFDPELGWDYRPVARNYVPGKRYLAQAYGDSFVEAFGVGRPEEAWQAHFERLTNHAILNMGVDGYGLDQAALKFEKYAAAHPTRIAILG